MIWKMGHVASWRFFFDVSVASASFNLLEKSSSVSSMSVKPDGGGLRVRGVRRAGIVGVGRRGGDVRLDVV